MLFLFVYKTITESLKFLYEANFKRFIKYSNFSGQTNIFHVNLLLTHSQQIVENFKKEISYFSKILKIIFVNKKYYISNHWTYLAHVYI